MNTIFPQIHTQSYCKDFLFSHQKKNYYAKHNERSWGAEGKKGRSE